MHTSKVIVQDGNDSPSLQSAPIGIPARGASEVHEKTMNLSFQTHHGVGSRAPWSAAARHAWRASPVGRARMARATTRSSFARVLP